MSAIRKLVRPDLDVLRLVTTQQGTERFRVTVATAQIGRPALGETDQAILDTLAGGKGLLTSDIAKLIDVTPRATRTRLAGLADRGLVREVGTGPQDPKRRYFRGE